jgi:hypothetical protein
LTLSPEASRCTSIYHRSQQTTVIEVRGLG